MHYFMPCSCSDVSVTTFHRQKNRREVKSLTYYTLYKPNFKALHSRTFYPKCAEDRITEWRVTPLPHSLMDVWGSIWMWYGDRNPRVDREIFKGLIASRALLREVHTLWFEWRGWGEPSQGLWGWLGFEGRQLEWLVTGRKVHESDVQLAPVCLGLFWCQPCKFLTCPRQTRATGQPSRLSTRGSLWGRTGTAMLCSSLGISEGEGVLLDLVRKGKSFPICFSLHVQEMQNVSITRSMG